MVKSLLTNTYNTREFGGHPLKNGGFTRCDRLWRSSVPRDITKEDIALLQEHRITTDIDVRTESALSKLPDPLQSLPGMAYHFYPIEEGAYVPASLAEVPVTYMEIARSGSVPSVFRAIAAAPEGVLLHCTAGKDRTGVICAILLLLCGAEDEEICRDYALSREYNRENLERMLREHPEYDRDAVTAQEISMITFLGMFREQFGTAEQYLAAIGLTDTEISALKNKLTE